MTEKDIKSIAIYLPQFHPFQENDDWWGKGFTEWTNVSRSRPKFKNHYQPHLPADMGFYDLRLSEPLTEQANLAREYGIYGFAFYHYWFNGKLLMERPLEQMLKSGEPDFPFCLTWANENWTRKWDGADQEILIEQNYMPEDDLAHIQYLIPFFKDPRYIKIQGKPVFLIYRSELHPDMLRATACWRDEARKAGFEDLYLIRIENFERGVDPATQGFNASMEFAPDITCAGKKATKKNILDYGLKKMLHRGGILKNGIFENNIYSLKDMAAKMLSRKKPDYTYFRCVCPAWDNSARRTEGATIYLDSEPDNFRRWVNEVKNYTIKNLPPEEQFLFINAWNEWAEGCHLEPDHKYGRKYLEAFKKGMEK